MSLTESPEGSVNGPHSLHLNDARCACGHWVVQPGFAPMAPELVVELYALHVASHAVHSFSEALFGMVTGDSPLWAKRGPKSRRVPVVAHSRLKQLMGYVYVRGS